MATLAEVRVLPGVERRDLVGSEVPSRQVLQAAIDKGITDVVVVGRSRDGSPYRAGSSNDIDRVVGMLMSAAMFLASGTYAQGIEDDAPEPDHA